MLGVDPAGDEFRSSSCQHAQKPRSILVDERDFIEVNDASASRVRAVVFLPARPELLNPRVDKPAMQNPSLFRGRFTECYFQHAVFLRACQ